MRALTPDRHAATGERIEWVDDGLGVISWQRGWPDVLSLGHVALAGVLGVGAGAGLAWAGQDLLVALTGAWFTALGVLLMLSDALGRILPDRFVLLSTGGVATGWALDALGAADPARLLVPLGWAVLALAVAALLRFAPRLVTGEDGFGAGDVKVSFPLALWLGHWGGSAVLAGFLVGVQFAGVLVVVRLLRRRMRRRDTVALGPWLVLGALLVTALVVWAGALA